MKSYVFPGDIEQDIRDIAARPIPYMRTDYFSGVVKECERMMLELINCPGGRVIFYTGSGTGAMDAVVSNYMHPDRKAFIIAGGSFGYRWRDICRYYGFEHHTYDVPFAKRIEIRDFETALVDYKPDVLFCHHHETSSGVLFDLEQISAVCKKHGVTLVVDAISSFLTDPLDMEALGIDMCILSSQKGLNILPGLSFVVLSPRMSGFGFSRTGYYFDFEENLKNLERGQTPYSPATALFMQLHERLKRDMQRGVQELIADAASKAEYFRSLCRDNGWEMPADDPSNCITAFMVERNGDRIFRELLEQQIYIMPSARPCHFRVSHCGVQSREDLDRLAGAIRKIERR